eukprot:CAMPEP_0114579256 /NCGR_PEP_ID=MMETSP0125-20121206/3663_1 /TAXON_ID=485358 ORGANISM="Aristerostoma sp., Strain ATCC 50986" /NCGR_SAMPLE_ID=MMETSP0125 /ASSEMBLY_ACC=CAM_ASM_000245 /LENGTH=93 /DNA_ID=CAMNT_0001769879 /DNA_START=298 /DNA_END=576 /DNA_ORIENTATION=+
MMVTWGEQVHSQIKLIQKHMAYFYKYRTYENEAFKEILKARSTLATEYFKKKRDMDTKKDKLYNEGNISKWDLDPQIAGKYNKEELKDKTLVW